MSLVFKIIVLELVAGISVYYDKTTCDRHHVLTDGPKSSDPTNRHDKQLTFFDINRELA